MKNANFRNIILLCVLSIALTAFVIGIFTNGFLQNLKPFWIICLNSIGIAFVSYLIVWYFLERFIYRRIKVIYKTIHSLKRGSKTNIQPKLNSNIIDSVQTEVFNWAKVKQEELADLQQQEKFRREYIGNVSHELKTPIFNMKGYIHSLIDGGLYDQSINMDFLLKSAKNLDRLTAIVEDLNRIAILESETEILNFAKVDIYNVAQDVLDSFENLADTHDVELKISGELKGPIYVEADPHYIRQVLVNLISNAIKYSNLDGGLVKLAFFDMADLVLVEIIDNGIGIHAESLPRLFERFYRVDKSRSRDKGGTGLGLAIVKHIIEAHGQTIHVRSKEGFGTTFGFTLSKFK